jgi:predicted ATPase/class 3 adenylate cyclase
MTSALTPSAGQGLPTGTVTFLFTDIEGSTTLAQQFPAEMPALLARHHAILHQAIQAYNGHVFQITGDAFCAAFHTAPAALIAALEAQRGLQHETWQPAPVRVRMGLHTGAAQAGAIEDRAGGYVGYLTLTRVQRVMSAAHGGQMLLSNPTAELVRGELPADVTLRDMGEHRLKGLLNPEHLWQLAASDLRQEFPPLQSLNAIPNNLPVQLTSFIGREREIAEVKQELMKHRLVTLTGSGGTGKTRLSLQVTAEVLDHFDHGVWFVELAPLVDPDLIPQTILSVMGISEQPGKVPLDILKEYLHDKKTLLVLDNCEHLIEASAKVANALLNAAPHLKVLASSREALGVKGEVSYHVPSLSLPDPKHLPAIEQLSQYEAVRLFIDRILLVAPHFQVTQANAPFIAQICYRLDGIPLAIELAAARVKMMSVEQISRRLDDRFRLLTGGARTALPRQQTLRALIDWSYDLLSENERLLLRQLSVFAGGWTLEAAEEVGADDVGAAPRVSPYEVLDLLTQLVNKSLVVVMEQSPSDETRYRMLETIRQYAREKLLETGGGEVVRDRHLAYFVKLVKQAETQLYQSDQVRWLNRLDDELDNLRMALEWALATDVESGLRIAAVPWRWWDEHGYFREMGEWLAQLLERYPITDSLHARALVSYSLCLFRRGDFADTFRIAGKSLQMARSLSDKQTEPLSLQFLGTFTLVQGRVGESTPLLEQSLALYRVLGDKVGQANVLSVLSGDSRNLEHATACARESIQLCRELGHLSGIGFSLTTLARLTFWSGDFSSPALWLEEALSIARQIGDQTAEAYALHTSGVLAYWQGHYRQANAYYEEVIRLSDKLGDHYQGSWACVFMAYAILRQGEIQQARELFEEYIQRAHQADWTIVLVFAAEGLASLNVNQDHPERAARLFAWADAMRQNIGDHRPPIEQASVERDLAIIHSQLDDTTFENARQTGRAMTLEQAIEYALKETDG